MSWMDRERFLEGFTYEVEKDFDVNSTPSSWADAELSLAHRYWGDEDHRIELPHPDDHTCRLSTSALTPDKKFIAASNGFVVNLYDVATKECHMVISACVTSTNMLPGSLFVSTPFPSYKTSVARHRSAHLMDSCGRSISNNSPVGHTPPRTLESLNCRHMSSSMLSSHTHYHVLPETQSQDSYVYKDDRVGSDGIINARDVEMDCCRIAQHQNTATRFRNELSILPRDLPEAKTRLPTLAMTVFDLAYITTKVFTIHKLNGDRSLIIAVTPLPWLFWYSRRKALGNITSSSLSS
ncbi:unnamed protein product, partial [Aureobasidium pullulans]